MANKPDATKKGPGTSVAPRRSTAVSNMDFGGVQSGAGMEGADRESFAIPFLIILQKLSPQLDKKKPEFLKGATDGMILNTATQQLYDGEEGVIVLPVAFKRAFTAWTIREKGGGFKGEYAPSDPTVLTTKRDDRGRDMLPDGQTQLSDTRLHSVILLSGEAPSPALLTFTSTQIKKSKRWMSEMQDRMRADNLPTFAHAYKLTTVDESNDKGSWSGWAYEYVGPETEQEHIDAAVSFYKALQSGAMKMRADQNADHQD